MTVILSQKQSRKKNEKRQKDRQMQNIGFKHNLKIVSELMLAKLEILQRLSM